MKVFLDFETRSKADIRAVGGHKYTKHLDSILCLAYQIDDGKVQLWRRGDPPPADLFDAIDMGAELHAHNAAFEIAVWQNHCVPELCWPPVPLEQWRCTAAKAAFCALPRSLGNCGKALKLEQLKSDTGRRVMLQLCKPRRPSKHDPSIWWEDEEKFQILYDYCIDDVKAERAIDAKLPNLTPTEQKIWLLDQEINLRGVAVDTELAENAIAVWEQQLDRLKSRISEVTEGEINSPYQVARIVDHANNHGVDMPKLDKAHVTKTLAIETLPEKLREVLELRLESAKTSVSKFKKILQCVEEDGRIRGAHMYHGATTGRWAGQHVQFQNLPRGGLDCKSVEWCSEQIINGDIDAIEMCYRSLGDVLASLIRSAVVAAPGKKLIVCDFASVEARGIAWLAGQEDLLELFASGTDVYVQMANTIYGTPVEQVTKQQRHIGKTCILGCGYGMGAAKFLGQCHKSGLLHVSKELAELAVSTFRTKFAKIQAFWYDLERTAMLAVENPGTTYTIGKLQWRVRGPWLWCKLPSGRPIGYYKPFIKQRKLPSPPWDEGEYKPAIHFTGVEGGKPKIQSTYGGMLAENVTQAVCRDLLAQAMLRLEAAGLPVVLHVHDEVVCEVEHGTAADVERIMSEVPHWAADFPISCEAFESRRYRK